jgi:hypothetical protein
MERPVSERARRPSRLAALLALVLALVFVVAGCSGQPAGATSGSGDSAAASAATAPTASLDPASSPSVRAGVASPPPSTGAPSDPSAPPSPSPTPAMPTVAITSPPGNAAISGPATSNEIAWTATDEVATEVTEEYTDGSSPNLDCRGALWRTARTIEDATSPLTVTDALPGHCYRFVVTVRSATGQSATGRSGTLWIQPAWRGGLDLYRPGVFATQRTFDWCLPAAVEMVLNIVDRRSVSSYAEQAAFYRYGRAHLYTDYPVPGMDPTSTIALLASQGQAYGDYRGASLDAMEREAVTQLRRTGKPVILYVEKGIHAWVLSGFTATADPAVTDAFTITSFSVLGPLWPTERYHLGYYDLPPDTKLSPGSFAAAVGGPFHERTRRVPWEGSFVITEPL